MGIEFYPKQKPLRWWHFILPKIFGKMFIGVDGKSWVVGYTYRGALYITASSEDL